jgi:hypothetical protein
MRSM